MGVIADSAMVVSAHPLASRVGASILKAGGNAVDAAVATQFALAVVYPSAGNLGGGGFMVLRNRDGSTASLDYREKAPGLSTRDMYLDEDGAVKKGLSEKGHLSSGVPGSVGGMFEAHQRYGSLPWKDLVQPAIDLAQNGFPLTRRQARSLNHLQDTLRRYNTIMPEFLLRDEWREGDTIYWKDLAHTLELIRDKGADGFYTGETADNIVAEMTRGNGLITRDDLRSYRPVWRQPLTGTYKNFRIISMGPPSSGGIALLQLLNAVENFPISDWGHNDARTVHLFTEAQRRVYADRAAWLGDPDFFNVPAAALTDKTYTLKRMQTFDPQQATRSSEVREGQPLAVESQETTHLSIVDQKGNAVAVTTTLNDSYGSAVIVAGSGFFLNDEMDDFSIKPGEPNMYGVIGGEANKIEPNKRMLSSMTPTILERDGKLFMVVGTPGGSTIITSVFQTIINVTAFDMNMQQAVNARRIHSQWLPEVIYPEQGAITRKDSVKLVEMGHRFDAGYWDGIGRVDAILVRPDGRLEGGADPRGDDEAVGW
ncbi:MAG TPA: gamma-glutamyltransferase [Chryseosolibacter sp.]|nr:gamma-glutamyltransferase [Chryseosolibacter sp.]